MVFGRNGKASQNLFESIDSSDSDAESHDDSMKRPSPKNRGRPSESVSSGRDRSRSRARTMAEKVASNLAYVSPRRLKPRLVAATTPNAPGTSKRKVDASDGSPQTGEDSCSVASESSLRDIDMALDSRNHSSASSLSSVRIERERDVTESPRRSRFWRPLSPLKKPSGGNLKRNESSGSGNGRPGLFSVPSLLDGEHLSKKSLLGPPPEDFIKPPSLRFKVDGRDLIGSSGHNSLPAMAFDIGELKSPAKCRNRGVKQDESTVCSRASSLSPQKTKQRSRQRPNKQEKQKGTKELKEVVSLTCSEVPHTTSNAHAPFLSTDTLARPKEHTSTAATRKSASNQANVAQNSPLRTKKNIKSPKRSKSHMPSRSASEVITTPGRRKAVVAETLPDPIDPHSQNTDVNADAHRADSFEPTKRTRSRSKSSKSRRISIKSEHDGGRTNQRITSMPKTPVREKRHRLGNSESLKACLEQNHVPKTPVSGRSVVTEVLRSKDSQSVTSDVGRRIRSRSVGRRTPRTPRTPRSRAMSRTIQASATPGRSTTKQRKPVSGTTRSKRHSSRHVERIKQQECDSGNNSLAQLHIPSLTDLAGEDVSVQFFKPGFVESQELM